MNHKRIRIASTKAVMALSAASLAAINQEIKKKADEIEATIVASHFMPAEGTGHVRTQMLAEELRHRARERDAEEAAISAHTAGLGGAPRNEAYDFGEQLRTDTAYAQFAFDLGATVLIGGAEGTEIGQVIARAEYARSEDAYLIRYSAADGRMTEAWWGVSALWPA